MSNVFVYVLYVSSKCYLYSYIFVLSGASLGMHLWRIGDAGTGGRCIIVCSKFVCFKYVLYISTIWCIFGDASMEMQRQEGGPAHLFLPGSSLPSYKPAFKT